jgi:hypothetical protein
MFNPNLEYTLGAEILLSTRVNYLRAYLKNLDYLRLILKKMLTNLSRI